MFQQHGQKRNDVDSTVNIGIPLVSNYRQDNTYSMTYLIWLPGRQVSLYPTTPVLLEIFMNTFCLKTVVKVNIGIPTLL